MNINDVVAKFDSKEELEAYCKAQHNTIVDLTKKLEALKLAPIAPGQPVIINPKEFLDNEEVICMIQIHRLRELAESRELTLEEAKKLEIYNKVLIVAKANKMKDVNTISKDIPDDELIKKLNEK